MTLSQAALPSDGLLREYLDYAEPLSDAPLVYHLFVGLTVIGVTLGNRVYIPFGNQRIYPNLWTALLGPSSFYRKTTAIGIGRDLLETFEDNVILPDEFSPERLFKKLQSNPVGLLTWSEFGHALSTFERSYMMGTKEFLTDIYDCRPKYKRELNQCTIEINNPAISILTASTPEWLKKRMREDDIRAGFYPRFLFVPAFKKEKRIAIPERPNYEGKNKLILGLRKLKDLAGEFDISQIEKGYEIWAFSLEDELHALEDAEMLGGFYARLSIYCLKFAMIYASSSGLGTFIDSGSMSKAISLTRYLCQCVRYLYSEELALTPEMRLKQKVLKIIQKYPGIQHSRLLTLSHVRARELKEALDSLIQEELIDRRVIERKPLYSPRAGLAELALISQAQKEVKTA